MQCFVGVRQAVDYWVTVHSLKSLDGGILDQDDRLIDVVDDREQVELIPRCLSWTGHVHSTSLKPQCFNGLRGYVRNSPMFAV